MTTGGVKFNLKKKKKKSTFTYGGANDDRYHLTSTSPFWTSSWASEQRKEQSGSRYRVEDIQSQVNTAQRGLLGGSLLPDISPECVAGKTMVLLLISTRAGGDCGVCGATGFVVVSLLTGSTGVAA